jgi:hypothetical protein
MSAITISEAGPITTVISAFVMETARDAAAIRYAVTFTCGAA